MQGSYAQVSGWAFSAGADIAKNVLARFATGRDALRLTCGVASTLVFAIGSAVPSLPVARVATAARAREAAVRVGARSIGVAGVRAKRALVNIVTASVAEFATMRVARSNCGARMASGAPVVQRLKRVFSDSDRDDPVARGIHEIVPDRVSRRLDA